MSWFFPYHRLLLLAVLFGLASGCAEWELRSPIGRKEPPAPAYPPPSAPPVAVAADPKSGGTSRIEASADAPRSAKREIKLGTGQFFGRAAPARADASAGADGEVSLNFVNADVRDVVRIVLGDILKRAYVVDPAVQGSLTIETTQPIARASIVAVLEAALRMSGIAMVDDANAIRIVPADTAARIAGMTTRTATAAGYGVQAVPLRFVGAEDMQRVLEPFAAPGSILRVDPARNLLLLGGTPQEIASLREKISMFDVDWLAGMSFALLPLKQANAKAVVEELTAVLGLDGGPSTGAIRLQPIARMNAVLAMSTQPRYMEQIEQWVDRLDQANDAAEQRIYIYPVQNGRAADLAAVLTKLLSTDSAFGSARPDEPTSQTASDTRRQAPFTRQSTGSQARIEPDQSTDATRPPPGAGTGTAGGVQDGVPAGGVFSARITADDRNNALLIAATAREFAIIEAALRKLDVFPFQVLIEAVIAEVTLTDDLRYGVQYLFQSGDHQVVRTDSATGFVGPLFPGFSYLFASGSNIRIVLNALESVTDVNVVSSPQLMVLNNQTATLQVGDQVPIAVQSAVSVITPGSPIVNTIQFRDTGVILKVTPRVNESGMVLMDITQEVSDVAPTTTSNIDSPTIQQRRVTSTIAVQNGETIALGGLIRDGVTAGNSGIPILKDIPVFGPLFGTRTDVKRRTELIALITPRVIRNQRENREVTDELRRKLRAASPLGARVR